MLQIARAIPDFPIVLETVCECLDDDLDVPRLRTLLEAIQSGEVRVQTRRGEIASPFASELIFDFTAAHLYEWDEPKRADLQAVGSIASDLMLEPLCAALLGRTGWIRKPSAAWKTACDITECRRGSVEEMAERLRLLGDMTASEVAGPMAAFLAELEQTGRAVRIQLTHSHEPDRWILAEESSQYLAAFPGASSGDEAGRSAIVRRFLATHALVAAADVSARYPVEPVEAAELLEFWCEQGTVVRIGEAGTAIESQWADRGNLTEMRPRDRGRAAPREHRRAAGGLRRFSAPPPARAPGEASGRSERGRGRARATARICAPASLWESEILPRRIKDYRPAWLDLVLARGNWFWRALGAGRDEPRVAFFSRDFPGFSLPAEPGEELPDHESRFLDLLDRNGASFTVDLARLSLLDPSRTRAALRGLMLRGLVTNDRFDPARSGSDATLQALSQALAGRERSLSLRPRAARRAVSEVPEDAGGA